MLLLQGDTSVITPQARDEALWQLVLYCEGRHGAPTDILDVRQKNFKTKVKKALRFTAMLLVDQELLHRFVAIDGVVSPSAIYTLDDHRLTTDSMWALVRAVDARGRCSGESHDGQQRRVTRSNIGPLLVAAEAASQRVPAVVEEKMSSATEDVSSSEDSVNDVQVESDENAEGGADNDEQEEEEELVDALVQKVTATPSKAKMNRKKKRRLSVPEKSVTQKRTKTAVSTHQVANMTTALKDFTLVPPPPKPCMLPSAIDRLSAVEFRHPDVRVGCFVDDDVHDLFCEHHVAWRRAVLSELRALSPATLQEMQSTASERHDMYNGALLRRWGHRVQVVWPIAIEGEDTHDALAHLSLELPQHDHGTLFYAHSVLADHADNLPGFSCPEQDTDSSRLNWIFASDHVRNSEKHGNSAHLQALCRIFLDTKYAWASFDGATGIPADGVSVDLLLRLGCMLVVVIQSEGSVVLVPSASAGESAHVVRGTAEAGPITGNFLSARQLCSVVDRQSRDGPTDAVKLEWAQDWAVHNDPEARSAIAPLPLTPVATEIVRSFLAEVDEDDPRYRPDYRRQSLIPELCLTGQAVSLLEVSNRELPIPLEHMADLWKLAATQDRQDTVSALSVKSLSMAAPRWYECSRRLAAHVKCRKMPPSNRCVPFDGRLCCSASLQHRRRHRRPSGFWVRILCCFGIALPLQASCNILRSSLTGRSTTSPIVWERGASCLIAKRARSSVTKLGHYRQRPHHATWKSYWRRCTASCARALVYRPATNTCSKVSALAQGARMDTGCPTLVNSTQTRCRSPRATSREPAQLA